MLPQQQPLESQRYPTTMLCIALGRLREVLSPDLAQDCKTSSTTSHDRADTERPTTTIASCGCKSVHHQPRQTARQLEDASGWRVRPAYSHFQHPCFVHFPPTVRSGHSQIENSIPPFLGRVFPTWGSLKENQQACGLSQNLSIKCHPKLKLIQS